jgi:hypothetical protein
MTFSGFRQEAFQFFQDLAKNNDKEWFDEHAESFENDVMTPMRELVEELRPFFTEIDPDLAPSDDIDDHISHVVRGPQAPPGTPMYKTSLYAFFWNTQLNRLSDASLYVGVTPEGMTLGFSIYDFGRERRGRLTQIFMPRLQTDLTLLDDYLKAAYLRRGFQFHRYARAAGRLGMREVESFPSKPADWQNTLGWVVKRHIHTESSRLTPGSFVSECQETFRRLHPLYIFASDPRPDWKAVLQKLL